MFEIREGDLPFIQTRRALLVLDLQNDLLADGCPLPVRTPEDLVEKTVNLAQAFRSAGKVIWIRSQFEAHRTINTDHHDSEHVITDAQIPGGHVRTSSQNLQEMFDKIMTLCEEEDGEITHGDDNQTREAASTELGIESSSDKEAFLTLRSGERASIMLPMLSGINFAQPIISVLDGSKDLMYTKSHYSAFKSGQLIQALRGNFVTELYICGALTNISIFATAMDAARYGYSLTLIEDCLGYRSKVRHDEALRQLREATGCEVQNSHDIMASFQRAAGISSRNEKENRGSRDGRTLSQMIQGMRANHDRRLPTERGEPSGPQDQPAEELSHSFTLEPEQIHDESGREPSPSTENLKGLVASLPNGTSEKVRRVPNKIKARQRHSKPISDNSRLMSLTTQASGSHGDASGKPHTLTHHRSKGVAVMPEKAATTEQNNAKPSKTAQLELTSGSLANSSGSGNKVATYIRSAPRAHTVARKDMKDSATDSIGEKIPIPRSNESDLSGRTICEGDTQILHDLLPDADIIFYRVKDEVRWQKMFHQGGEVPRLVAVQGEVAADGSRPVYRHPTDESPKLLPFSPTISIIRAEVERRLGHKVNHCLIQLYRDGADYISEHSDKTLDIAPGSFIANVSLGASRIMTFRTKKQSRQQEGSANEELMPRSTCRISLPHNSLLKMSLATNRIWLHSIRPDKQQDRKRTEAEYAYDDGRISITFRHISTFLSKDQTHIWGQGAVAKHQYDARPVKNGNTLESDRLIKAFGKENHDMEFDWQEAYGRGFDVLHFSNMRKLFLSGDFVSDLIVKIFLAEYEVNWTISKLSPPFNWKAGDRITSPPSIPDVWPVVFVDNDLARSVIEGEIAISVYLEAFYGRGATAQDFTQTLLAKQFTRRQESRRLLREWRKEPFEPKAFRWILAIWEDYASEDDFIAGPVPTSADYAFWPVLHEIIQDWGLEGLGLKTLAEYYERMKCRPAFVKALAAQTNGDMT